MSGQAEQKSFWISLQQHWYYIWVSTHLLQIPALIIQEDPRGSHEFAAAPTCSLTCTHMRKFVVLENLLCWLFLSGRFNSDPRCSHQLLTQSSNLCAFIIILPHWNNLMSLDKLSAFLKFSSLPSISVHFKIAGESQLSCCIYSPRNDMYYSMSVTPGVGHRVLPTVLLPAAPFMLIL